MVRLWIGMKSGGIRVITENSPKKSSALTVSGVYCLPPQLAAQYEFAAPVLLQTQMLTKRLFTHYWRDPSYIYSKIFVSFAIGIFNGFVSYRHHPREGFC